MGDYCYSVHLLEVLTLRYVSVAVCFLKGQKERREDQKQKSEKWIRKKEELRVTFTQSFLTACFNP